MGEGAFYTADIHSNNLMFCLGTLDKFVKLKGIGEGAFYIADTHSGNLNILSRYVQWINLLFELQQLLVELQGKEIQGKYPNMLKVILKVISVRNPNFSVFYR